MWVIFLLIFIFQVICFLPDPTPTRQRKIFGSPCSIMFAQVMCSALPCGTLLWMIDPNSAPQVIQQIHPSWFDWITVAAIVVGPVLALFAQRVLDRIREKRDSRVETYLTAMALRGAWLHPDSIEALNSIDVVFDKASDKPVRNAWAAVMTQVRIPRPPDEDRDGQRAWDARLLDLRVDLYQLMGAAVGYDHTVDYIKNQIYMPQYHVEAELEQIQIRKQFAKAITEDGLKVVLNQRAE